MKIKSGFTLIELLVVVAIIGILAAIGTIGYLKYIENANIAVVKSNLSSVASALKVDISSLSNGISHANSALLEDMTGANTCENIAKATVNFINKQSNLKNPYTNQDNAAAAYGNYMTQIVNGKITQIIPFKKGSIIVSCSITSATPMDEEFLLYECSCDTDTCAFDSVDAQGTENCRIPSPSSTMTLDSDPYSP
jgi:prepilin-type N-terminal cleavage/methylation domain-containing protein